MSHTKIKMIVGGLTILTAVTALAVLGVRDGWAYFLPVDEFVASPARQTQRVRLHGIVQSDGLEASAASVGVSFTLGGEQSSLPVNYTGVVPDMFQADREVVVEGKLDDQGVFQADVLLTKCSSKYTSDGQSIHDDPRIADEESGS